LWRLRDLPPEKRDEAAKPLLLQFREQLSDILSARQLERFDQIVLQAQGISGILRIETASRLRLSTTQIGTIRRALTAMNRRIATSQRTDPGA